MQLHVTPGDELPIYRQIVRQIGDAIAGAQLSPGQKLPSHRDLAVQLVVAPLTVKKAYDELERAGLLETSRGRGTFVSQRAAPAAPSEARERLREPARRLLAQARLLGVGLDQVRRVLEDVEEEERP